MIRLFLAGAAMVQLANPASGLAQNGPAPLQARAAMTRDGQISVWKMHGAMSVPMEAEFSENGVQRKMTIYKKTGNLIQLELELRLVRVFDTEGRTIESEQLPDLLAKDVAVLVSSDGEPVDGYYLQLIKKGTTILVLAKGINMTHGGYAGYGYGVPMPGPPNSGYSRPMPAPGPAPKPAPVIEKAIQ